MKKAYLDSSFLVCIFIPNHPFQQSAINLFATLKKQGYKFFISPLVIDELWWAVFREKNKLGQIKVGIKDAFKEIKKSWETIQNYKILQTIQIKKPVFLGIKKALVYINRYNLGPRDSFHLSIANSQGISDIVVKDKDFTKPGKNFFRDGFNIIDF